SVNVSNFQRASSNSFVFMLHLLSDIQAADLQEEPRPPLDHAACKGVPEGSQLAHQHLPRYAGVQLALPAQAGILPAGYAKQPSPRLMAVARRRDGASSACYADCQ